MNWERYTGPEGVSYLRRKGATHRVLSFGPSPVITENIGFESSRCRSEGNVRQPVPLKSQNEPKFFLVSAGGEFPSHSHSPTFFTDTLCVPTSVETFPDRRYYPFHPSAYSIVNSLLNFLYSLTRYTGRGRAVS